jgi:peptidoglycan/LPS O-acetylase OafA/YrhL
VVVLGCFVGFEILKLALTHASGVATRFVPFDPRGSTSLASIPANILMTHALHLFPVDTWNSPSWSISTEFYTYVVFALLSLIAARRLAWAAALIVVAGEAVLWTQATSIDVTHDLGFVRCVVGFFAGHLTYRLWTRSRTITPPGFAEPLCLILALVFMSLTMTGRSSFLAPLVFAACVWVFAHEAGPVARALNTRPFQALGRWSYSIYMVHFFIVVGFYRVVAVAKLGAPGNAPDGLIDLGNRYVMDVIALGYLGLVILVAAAATRFVETPTRAWFNARARTLTLSPQPAPVSASGT